MTKIKICGITNIDDARQAVSAGADYIGLIFVKESPRSIDFDAAKQIVHELDDLATIVGVFKNLSPAEVDITASALGLSMVQYHGDESPERCAYTEQEVIKAFELKPDLTPESIGQYISYANYILLDKPKNDSQDAAPLIQTAANLIKGHKELPLIFFAGGLTCENVKEAIMTLKPFAVDVASGVESAPGKKDHDKVKRFCRTVKETSLCNH